MKKNTSKSFITGIFFNIKTILVMMFLMNLIHLQDISKKDENSTAIIENLDMNSTNIISPLNNITNIMNNEIIPVFLFKNLHNYNII
jgi:hypothetical protein